MMRVLHPAGWPVPRGYANGIEARGRQVFISGQVGWDPSGRFPHADFVGQVELALRNIVAVLAEAGGRPEHLVRLTWYVLDRAEYLAHPAELGQAYRAVLGRHYPAMSVVVVAGLVEPEARVEIEATAVIPDDART